MKEIGERGLERQSNREILNTEKERMKERAEIDRDRKQMYLSLILIFIQKLR